MYDTAASFVRNLEGLRRQLAPKLKHAREVLQGCHNGLPYGKLEGEDA
jgi:hypothetical protein